MKYSLHLSVIVLTIRRNFHNNLAYTYLSHKFYEDNLFPFDPFHCFYENDLLVIPKADCLSRNQILNSFSLLFPCKKPRETQVSNGKSVYALQSEGHVNTCHQF